MLKQSVFLIVNVLLGFQNFSIDGMVCKTDIFNKFGGLKKNIKLTFVYEFLLRLTYNDVKIMTIPKMAYQHTNLRPNSLFHNYQNPQDEKYIKPQEGQFWIETAKKEFYWNKDREITYEEATLT